MLDYIYIYIYIYVCVCVLHYIYIYIYKEDLALNNLHWLIYIKTQLNPTQVYYPRQYELSYLPLLTLWNKEIFYAN